MINLKKLDNIGEKINNLDLTNRVLSQIIMFLYNSTENISYGKNDKIIFKNEKDKKIVNDLMNVLLDYAVGTNEKLTFKVDEILNQVDDGHELKRNINHLFKVKGDLQNTNNRFDELKKRSRLDSQENSEKRQIKSKNLEGFIPLYEKPDGAFEGDIQFKLIDKPATQKQLEKYKNANDWVNSKYFNIWMAKISDQKEIYLTQLVNLLYGSKEALYKVRSTKKINREILVKFIPNVELGDIKKFFYKNIGEENYEENYLKDIQRLSKNFNMIRDKFDKKSILKLAIINLLIKNRDLNIDNLLVKKNGGNLQFIPIDFGNTCLKLNEKPFLQSLTLFFQNQYSTESFEKVKKNLINYYDTSFQKIVFQSIFEKEDIFKYYLNKFFPQEFKEILGEIIEKYNDIKVLLREYNEKICKDNKESLIQNIKLIEKIENSIDSIHSLIIEESKNQANKDSFQNVYKNISLININEENKNQGSKAQNNNLFKNTIFKFIPLIAISTSLYFICQKINISKNKNFFIVTGFTFLTIGTSCKFFIDLSIDKFCKKPETKIDLTSLDEVKIIGNERANS